LEAAITPIVAAKIRAFDIFTFSLIVRFFLCWLF
jgi:hypothetical protein